MIVVYHYSYQKVQHQIIIIIRRRRRRRRRKYRLQRAHSQVLSMNRRRGQSTGGRREYGIVNELGHEVSLEVALETI